MQDSKMFDVVLHIIFDLDGLILDTEFVYDMVIQDIASRYGKTYSLDIRNKIRGTWEPETARLAVTEMELPLSPEQFLRIYKPMVAAALQQPSLLPGAEKLILHFHKHNVPIAIATSAAREITEIKTKNYKDLFSLFHHVVMGSSDKDITRGKPDPDIFLVCASRFPDKPNPAKCLVFEDAPNGVTAAIRAGMQVVMVPSPEVTGDLRKGATQVLNSLMEFRPEQFGLPALDG